MATKYDETVNKVQNKGNEGAAMQKVSADAQLFISKFEDKDLEMELHDPKIEWAPENYSLEAGQKVEGILEGNGPDAEFERVDEATGVVTTNVVKTWIISSLDGSKRISILSSIQLDRKMAPFVGGFVKVLRKKDTNIGNGKRMTEYLVGGHKLPEGQKRVWATKPVIEITGGEVKALPAGNAEPNHAATAQHAAPVHAAH